MTGCGFGEQHNRIPCHRIWRSPRHHFRTGRHRVGDHRLHHLRCGDDCAVVTRTANRASGYQPAPDHDLTRIATCDHHNVRRPE